MAEYKNFFETIEEANKRLQSTIICYANNPYTVYWITEHKDGIFRIYLVPVNLSDAAYADLDQSLPSINDFIYQAPVNKEKVGELLDKWMNDHPKSPMLRKQMNSPHFNKFRPFPLGMCNYGTEAFYLERLPLRRSEQGLVSSAINETPCRLIRNNAPMGSGPRFVSLHSDAFAECVQGKYPTAQQALEWLLDPNIDNTSIAFSRHFALVRGPIGMIFLAYKTDTVGVLTNDNLSSIRIGKNYKHVTEVTQELKVFHHITVQA